MSKATDEKAEKYVDPLKLKGKGTSVMLSLKKKAEIPVVPLKACQVRVDTDPGYDVDVKRGEQFGEVMKAAKDAKKANPFPEIKCVCCEDAPGYKGQKVYIPFDGHHTLFGAEYAKLEELAATVWEGTYAQALAAASHANEEHAGNGKPPSYKDRINSLRLFVKGLEIAEIPKAEWPSNRQLAEVYGLSRTAVNDEDPCGRRPDTSKSGAQKKAEKKAQREAAKAAAAAAKEAKGKETKTWEIVKRSTGQVDGKVELPADADAAKAVEVWCNNREGAEAKHFAARPAAAEQPKPGTEVATPGKFDWAGMDGQLGYIARGFDSMSDLFALKETPEFKAAMAHYEEIVKQFRDWRKKFGPQKGKATG